MDPHLDQERLAQWIAGGRDSQARMHVRDCEACRRQIGELEGILHAFRGDAHAQAELSPMQWARQRNAIAGRLRSPRRVASRWAVATVTLIALGIGLLAAPSPKTPAMPWQQVAADSSGQLDEDALLAEVADALDRDTPEALAPAGLLMEERDRIVGNKSSGTGVRKIPNGGRND